MVGHGSGLQRADFNSRLYLVRPRLCFAGFSSFIPHNHLQMQVLSIPILRMRKLRTPSSSGEWVTQSGLDRMMHAHSWRCGGREKCGRRDRRLAGVGLRGSVALDKDMWPSQSLSFPSSQADNLAGLFYRHTESVEGPWHPSVINGGCYLYQQLLLTQ